MNEPRSPATSSTAAAVSAEAELVHEAQSALVQELLPAWFDKDPAADAPNYLGYIFSILPAVTIALFAGMALLLRLLYR